MYGEAGDAWAGFKAERIEFFRQLKIALPVLDTCLMNLEQNGANSKELPVLLEAAAFAFYFDNLPIRDRDKYLFGGKRKVIRDALPGKLDAIADRIDDVNSSALASPLSSPDRMLTPIRNDSLLPALYWLKGEDGVRGARDLPPVLRAYASHLRKNQFFNLGTKSFRLSIAVAKFMSGEMKTNQQGRRTGDQTLARVLRAVARVAVPNPRGARSRWTSTRQRARVGELLSNWRNRNQTPGTHPGPIEELARCWYSVFPFDK